MSTRPITPQCSCVPRPVRAHEADGVRVIDHHQRVVLVRQVADAAQVGDDAVHREHAVGGDQPEARVRAASCSFASRSAMSLFL